MQSNLDSFDELAYEENIPQGEDMELSTEIMELFVQLFGGEILERCRDLFEGLDGPAS